MLLKCVPKNIYSTRSQLHFNVSNIGTICAIFFFWVLLSNKLLNQHSLKAQKELHDPVARL